MKYDTHVKINTTAEPLTVDEPHKHKVEEVHGRKYAIL